MKRVVFAVIAVLGSLVVVPAGAATKPPVEQHCVVQVIGQEPDGEYMTTPVSCFETFEAAMTASGVSAGGVSSPASTTSFTIGTHFDGANLTGSSFSVVGDNCGGGWLNVNFFWNNRISSTLNGCPRINHFDGTNLTGAFQITVGGGGNLTTLNNKTSSIQYTI